MSEKTQQKFLNVILLFVLLQPFLDILSRLAIIDVIPNISTYVKPLFVFTVALYLVVKYSPIKKKWIIYAVFFSIFALVHLYLLYQMLIGMDIILHELRFMINIAYMIALFASMFTLIHWSKNDESMYKKIKYVVVYTFGIYLFLYLLAVVTGTSFMTYEYADKAKQGFKGWYDSGQILGHALSILFPIILYTILKPNKHKLLRFTFLALVVLCVSLLGTKVPYFITLIVLILYLIIIVVLRIINNNFIFSKYNIFIVVLAIVTMIGTYQFTPVAFNTDINNRNAKITLDNYDLSVVSGKKVNYEDIFKNNPKSKLFYVKRYYKWQKQASSYLQKQFVKGVVHPANTRDKQLFYSMKLYDISTPQYKIFGLGFLNQEDSLSLERDFFMAIFNFGIIGFILFLLIPILAFIKATKFIINNIKNIDLEICMLYMGLGIFFCISIYAGYSYIYTNFSIFLVLLITMLNLKIKILNKTKIKNIKKVNFLALHLGYGGIESSIINSANALSDKYEIEIISLYKLKNDQKDKLNKKVNVTYLYDGEPNRKEINLAKEKRQMLKLIKELFKAFVILHKKKTLMSKAIKNINDGAIVSTRVEFNVLLSKYGKNSVLKIAQEHCYHNNKKSYINKIANKYHNIDYLCALTKTLYSDYKKFLKYNNHTKVVLLPNMLFELPKKHSELKSLNFITVGRLDYGKRNNEIIDNFSKMKNKNTNLYIIGDGIEYGNLEKQIKSLNLEKRVHLLGYLDHKDQEKYLLNSCCFLMTSVTEGLPMVLLEAMSYGLPCIVYKTASGTGDIVKNNINGFIINNRNSKKYISCMDKIVSEDKLKIEMGKEAVRTSFEFSKNEILKIWKGILDVEI